MYNNFTSLSTTYDYSLPQVQLTMPLLTNRRYGSALATKHPYLTVWARLPHQWYLTSDTGSWQQPEPRLLPPSLCLKHPSAVFRANCFSSCKTQLNCPLLQETNYFFH